MAVKTQSQEFDLRPLGEGTDWNIGVVSMPLPKGSYHDVKIKGVKAQSVPIAWWPRSEKYPGGPRIPRRSMVYFYRPKDAEHVEASVVRRTRPATGKPGAPEGWNLSVKMLENAAIRGDETYFSCYRQPCELVMAYGKKQIGLRLGIENDTGLHIWQYVNSEQLWTGPVCSGWRIGGHIYTRDEDRLAKDKLPDEAKGLPLADDTIQASVYLILFADGTARVTGHWINGRIYGADGNQKGKPVVVFRNLKAEIKKKKWDGNNPIVEGATATLNLERAAHLVSEEFPGKLTAGEDHFLTWQPVHDTRIRIRYIPVGPVKEGETNSVTKIDVAHSTEGLVEGAARSVTWDIGFGQTPRIKQFLAPAAWYGKNQEFAPFPIKPREGKWSALSLYAANQVKKNSVKGRFTSGAVMRYFDMLGQNTMELSMDANESRSLYRRSYWDGDYETYDLAERNAYFSADLTVDHVRDVVHYHGDTPQWRVYSSIYMRFSGLIFGYLETGDYYLLETAEAVARNYITHHLLNWPRKGIGRDAEPMVGMCLLWDYTGDEHYIKFARRFAGDVASVIAEDGKWHCGSGVGPLMGINAAEGGVWNGGHFFSGFTPYLAREQDVPQEWLDAAKRGFTKLMDDLETKERDPGLHPAGCGFMGGPHWYLACRLKDKDLIRRVRKAMDFMLEYHEKGGTDRLFHGGRAHHMNNYLDNLLFYECTHDTLPEKV